ncbi:hypothetical protein L6164_026922 [Bauhinia variegata]|uniref:Uncharacterized protein n=1 Tax=Bauhinia variegata TaxID=167791 RepID=A0ACB9LRZ2_BAUVA|nr:hypothetical protein L6164_026922 [Bauhinia variegata]
MESLTVISHYLAKIPAAMFLVVSVFAVVAFCAKHGRREGKQSPNGGSSNQRLPRSSSPLESPRKLVSNISNKALPNMFMKSKQEEGKSGETSLWKKPIIMGERCQPLQFSGAIYYDAEGNRLPHPPRSPRTSPLHFPVFGSVPAANEGKYHSRN